jgi:hypothetical protein
VANVDEHGIYLRNHTPAADYAGSTIEDCTITDWGMTGSGGLYGIQTSNEGDSLYQITGLTILRNTLTGPAADVGGGMVLAGLDGARVQNNTIDLTAVTGASDNGISLSWVGVCGARNSTISNNVIRGALTGLSAGDASGTYKPLRNYIHNNFLVGCTTEWVVGAMVGAYHLSNNCGVGGTTAFPDSAGTFADSTSWRMKWGGKRGLDGIVANSFGAVNVGINPATGLAATGLGWPFIGPYQSAAGIPSVDIVGNTVGEIVALIAAGVLPESDPTDITTYYGIKAPRQESEKSQFSVVLDEWEALTAGQKATFRMLVR